MTRNVLLVLLALVLALSVGLVACGEGEQEEEEEEVVVYDFVAQASNNKNKWGSRTPGMDLYDPLTFGATDSNMGFACYRTDAVLEDNLTYDKVLETHPRWVDDGVIRGEYWELLDLGYEVTANDRFYAKVGFLNGAAEGNVTFSVALNVPDDPFPVISVAEITDAYDGTLRTIDVDLSPYAGKRGWFFVEVHANGSSGQDWATWVEAKIIR